MSASIRVAGRVSSRIGAALSMVSELAWHQARYSTDSGYHAATGFMAKPRELSPSEKKLFQASLRFLLRGFEYKFDSFDSRQDFAALSMWTYAANAFLNFVLACTVEVDCKEDFEAPPHRLARVLSELEQEVADAAAMFLVRAYELSPGDACMEMDLVDYDDDDDDDDEE